MSKKIGKNVLEVLPHRRYDYENECYITADNKVLDIIQVKCKDFTAQSSDEIERDMLILTEYFRLYVPDFNIVAINIPTNCEEQIAFLNYKIEHCTNEYRKNQLLIKKEEQEWIEKNRLNKEFYIMYFGNDMEEYKKNRGLIQEKLGNNNLLVPISKKQKDIVFMKMNNKNVKS